MRQLAVEDVHGGIARGSVVHDAGDRQAPIGGGHEVVDPRQGELESPSVDERSVGPEPRARTRHPVERVHRAIGTHREAVEATELSGSLAFPALSPRNRPIPIKGDDPHVGRVGKVHEAVGADRGVHDDAQVFPPQDRDLLHDQRRTAESS